MRGVSADAVLLVSVVDFVSVEWVASPSAARRSGIHAPLFTQLDQFHGVLELTAGGIDIASARATDEGWNSRPGQHLLKRQHAFLRWHREGNLRSGVQCNQVDLGPQAADE